jgi:hypothetical protein
MERAGRFVRDPHVVGTDLHTARDRRNEYLRRVAPSPWDMKEVDSFLLPHGRTKVSWSRTLRLGEQLVFLLKRERLFVRSSD